MTLLFFGELALAILAFAPLVYIICKREDHIQDRYYLNDELQDYPDTDRMD